MKKYIIEIKTKIYVEEESEQNVIEKYNSNHYENGNYLMKEEIFNSINQISI